MSDGKDEEKGRGRAVKQAQEEVSPLLHGQGGGTKEGSSHSSYTPPQDAVSSLEDRDSVMSCHSSQFVRPPMSKAKQMTVLVLVSLLPFGGHIVKNCLSSLEVFMLSDPRLNLTETRYGLMLSMSSLPNFFVPFFGGVFLDKRGSRFATLVFLFLILVGQTIFTIAMQLGQYELGLLGRFVVGLGEGSVLVAQRAVISQHFRADSQITFAIGFTVATAGLAKTLGRATVVPASNYLGSYIGGLWYTVLACLFSTLAGLIFIVITDEGGDNLPIHKVMRRRSNSTSSPRASDESAFTDVCHIPTLKALVQVPWSLGRLSWAFWMLVVQHAVYINLFHIFLNFSSHYFTVRYHRSPQVSALITSTASVVVIFMGPVVGYFLDRFGGQLHVCFVTSLLVIAAYYCLMIVAIDPLFPVILLSIGESFIPIIVMALVPITVHNDMYGAAFGVMEVTGSATSFAGNVMMGYIADETGSYDECVLLLLYLAMIGSAIFFVMSVFECSRRTHINHPGPADLEALASIDE